MQPGDLISLGSFSPLLPPKAGLSVLATYDGPPGAVLALDDLELDEAGAAFESPVVVP